MSDPTPTVRRAVYERDGWRCVACNAGDALTFQHRRRVGMGGSPIRPEAVDGATACGTCNQAFEHRMQTLALAFGWKVKAWVKDPAAVPMYYPHEFQWHRLEGSGRFPISAVVALDMMHAVYGDRYFEWRND